LFPSLAPSRGLEGGEGLRREELEGREEMEGRTVLVANGKTYGIYKATQKSDDEIVRPFATIPEKRLKKSRW